MTSLKMHHLVGSCMQLLMLWVTYVESVCHECKEDLPAWGHIASSMEHVRPKCPFAKSSSSLQVSMRALRTNHLSEQVLQISALPALFGLRQLWFKSSRNSRFHRSPYVVLNTLFCTSYGPMVEAGLRLSSSYAMITFPGDYKVRGCTRHYYTRGSQRLDCVRFVMRQFHEVCVGRLDIALAAKPFPKVLEGNADLSHTPHELLVQW